MQHIENDMDDLFKRAADNYPLLGGADSWDRISKRIAEGNGKSSVDTLNNRSNKFILFASLISLLLIGGLLLLKQETAVPLAGKSKEVKAVDNYRKPRNHSGPVLSSKTESFKISDAVLEKRNYQQSVTGLTGGTTFQSISGMVTDSIDTYHLKENIKKTLQSKTTAHIKDNNPADVYSTENRKDELVKSTLKKENKADEKQKSSIAFTPFKDKAGENEKSIIPPHGKKDKAGNSPKNSAFYFGLMAAPELSKVGSMPFGNIGFNAGIIAGFNLNRRLSLEGGIYRIKKYYKSEGKDFNAAKIQSSMAYGMVINSLESKSSLIEIPIKVKYNIGHKKNMGLFITGGLSAYVMTEENNLYQVTFNGSGEQVNGIYKKNNYGVPAVAGISIGYQYPLFKKLQMRIEPFLKIPINGMGVGNLPITGAGLQFGIIRPFN